MCFHYANKANIAEKEKKQLELNKEAYIALRDDLKSIQDTILEYIKFMSHLDSCMKEIIVNGDAFDKGKVGEERNNLISASSDISEIVSYMNSEIKSIETEIEAQNIIISRRNWDCTICIKQRDDKKAVLKD